MDEPLDTLIDRLDSKSAAQQEAAWIAIRPRGVTLMCELKRAYARFKKMEGRVALVFHATAFARISDCAFDLGLLALNDRSRLVRERACGLLAYSLRGDAIINLTAISSDPVFSVREAAKAAVNAIHAQNHHLFVDRTGDGRTFWVVNRQDDRR